MVSVWNTGQGRAQPSQAKAAPLPTGSELTAWIVIRPDETVIVRVARAEVGQGTATALAQLVAEELDCDWSKVKVEHPSPNESLARQRVYRDFVTSQSRGVRGSQEYMRQAGATARAMLIDAAATLWKVPAAELSVANGIVSHRASNKRTTYGKLAAQAAARREPDQRTTRLTEPKDWEVAGKSVNRLGNAEVLDGRAIYGIDMSLPGLLCAAIKDAPVFGAKLKSFDADAVAAKPGVRHVLKVGETAVAVVADTWWQAKKAIDILPAEWEETPEGNVSSQSIAEHLKDGLEVREGFIGTAHGDALKAIGSAQKKVEAIYAMPYLHHAALEPMNATARWSPAKLEVWAPTQNAEGAHAAAAEAGGMKPSQVEFSRTLTGGSFGRRGRHDAIRQVVLIARQIPNVPVKLIWSREEDTRHGFYRPATQAKLVGGIDEKGEVSGLILRISSQSILAAQSQQRGKDPRMFQGLFAEAGEAQLGYSIPNLYIDHVLRSSHVPVGSWRGVHSNQNAIYLECFVDELAVAAGKDPYDFRRGMMRSHAKHLATLTAAGEKAGWGRPAPNGIYRGIAQAMAFGTYAAAVAEVWVHQGVVSVRRIVLALDPGNIVNPNLVMAQIEGQVAFGLSALFYQEITIKDGRTVEGNFDTYGVLRIAEMPVVESVLVPSGGFWGGVGEAAIPVVAPAVLNAIYAATGKRVRSLPLKNVKLN